MGKKCETSVHIKKTVLVLEKMTNYKSWVPAAPDQGKNKSGCYYLRSNKFLLLNIEGQRKVHNHTRGGRQTFEMKSTQLLLELTTLSMFQAALKTIDCSS